jgi:hypothetical protein
LLEDVPTVISAPVYGTEWVKWWTTAQPRERKTQQWPFSMDGTNISWSKFPANGKDGIFLAVMGLSWWATAVRSSDEVVFFEQAVTDLHWVVQELTRTRTTQISPPSPPPSQDKSDPPQHSLTPRGSSSSSRPPVSSSRPRVSTLGVHIHPRGEGKRIIIPTRKALANR